MRTLLSVAQVRHRAAVMLIVVHVFRLGLGGGNGAIVVCCVKLRLTAPFFQLASPAAGPLPPRSATAGVLAATGFS